MHGIGVVERKVVAEATARMLFEVGAVHFRTDEPYTFTSGLKSPVYIDCRKLISYPRIRATLIEYMAAAIAREAGYERFDAVAGGETAGIPYAAWLADRLALPMLYVRKKPKGFGRDAQIEGALNEGQRVLLVEDLTTDGGSKIAFCEALRKAGAVVTDTAVVFYYDIFKATPARLADVGLRLHYLATWWDVLAHARHERIFDEVTLTEVESFLHQPLPWSSRHGGQTVHADVE